MERSRTLNGRAASGNPPTRYLAQQTTREHEEGLDEPEAAPGATEFHLEHARSIVQEIASPDVGPTRSINPYQGCEHGCAYCYARPTHAYWGYGAGVDFERHVLYKPDAPALLEQAFKRPNWEPRTISLSGNTDCYQPAERRWRITRALLEVFLRYRHPVGIITKNSLVLRDLDLLEALAADNLVRVHISITTLRESLRRRMEPRTASGKRRLDVVRTLSQAGIPVHAMVAPVIPALNDDEIPRILEAAAEAGAKSASMQVVRLNREVAPVFTAWLLEHYPQRMDKVLQGIRALHGGQLSDSQFGRRMRGVGPEADALHALFHMVRRKYYSEETMPALNNHIFRRQGGTQLPLFGSHSR